MRATYSELVVAATRLLDALDEDVAPEQLTSAAATLRALVDDPLDPSFTDAVALGTTAIAPRAVVIRSLTRSQRTALVGHRVRVTCGMPGATMHMTGRLLDLDDLGARLEGDTGRVNTASPVTGIGYAVHCAATLTADDGVTVRFGPCQRTPGHQVNGTREVPHCDAQGRTWRAR